MENIVGYSDSNPELWICNCMISFANLVQELYISKLFYFLYNFKWSQDKMK